MYIALRRIINLKPITENIIYYKLGKPPMNIVMVGTLFIVIGITLVMWLWFLKIPLLLAGIGIITSRDRLAVDFENQRIKKYVLMLGFRLGKWQSIKGASYISLVRVRMSRKENFFTIGTQRAYYLIKANLFFPDRQYITLFKQPAARAFEMVKTIALGFGLDIYDQSKRKHQKISPRILHGRFDGTE